MQNIKNNCRSKGTDAAKHILSSFGVLVASLLIFTLLPLCSQGFAATPWNIEIDASENGFIEAHSFGNMQVGFTYVVPPDLIRQNSKTEQTESGWLWTLQGTELSVWQTVPTPQDARYLMSWHFEYEGQVVDGGGRTGFIFGNPENANLMSVEVTRAGSLQLLSWGKDIRGSVGRVVWSKKAAPGGKSPVKIVADYDIRQDTLTCSVNGGSPIRIELGKHTASGPMTIKAVGFFGAVPEARIVTGTETRSRQPEYEIDLSTQRTRVEHRRLSVKGS